MSAMKRIHVPAAAAGTIQLGDDRTVNRMGYGAMRLTGKGIWGPPRDHDEAVRVLRRAIELGVNFIDTANSYGPHVSEELIAEALHPYPDDLVIATKGGFERTGPDRWILNCDPAALRRELEGSLQRLRLERIELWQLHRIDKKIPEDDQLDAIGEFQRQGMIRHIGLSEVSVADITRVRQRLDIVSVQNRYNVDDREWDDVVDYCDREGIAFMPWYPLSAGALEDGGAVERVAERHDATVYQVALAWLLARSKAMLVIPGTSTVSHLEENVAAAELVLTDDDLAELDEA